MRDLNGAATVGPRRLRLAASRWLWDVPDGSPIDLRRRSRATLAIAGITVAVFVPDVALPPWRPGIGQLTHAFGLTPALVRQGEWWRLITPNLINPPRVFGQDNWSALSHLGFSLIGLAALGPRLERQLGAKGLLLLYVASGAAAYGWADIAGPEPAYIFVGGSSGAVAGLLGAALIGACRRTRESRSAGWYAGALLAGTALVAFFSRGDGAGPTAIHVGGLVAGAAIGTLLDRRRPTHRLTPPATEHHRQSQTELHCRFE